MISDFGKQVAVTNHIGTLVAQVQESKRRALQTTGLPVNWIDLGSGSPPLFPEMVDALERECLSVARSGDIGEALCQYGAVFADTGFKDELCALFRDRGVQLDESNLLVTPGAMAAIFYASHVFAGETEGSVRKILIPQAPEFPDYVSMGLPAEFYTTLQPNVVVLDEHRFRYELDLDKIDFKDVGMVLLSRPCNPSGRVMPDESLRSLIARAEEYGVIVVVDAAYSEPFPGLVYNGEPADMVFGSNVINIMSLSKAGLAGDRVGIALGPRNLIAYLKTFQLNFCLTAPNLGQALAARLLRSGELQRISKQVIAPFYKRRIDKVHAMLGEHFGSDVPYRVHEAEGGMFVWIWLPGLAVTSDELCRRLRQESIIVAPGEVFFQGLDAADWRHREECVRISVIESEDHLREGVRAFCDAVNRLFAGSTSSALQVA